MAADSPIVVMLAGPNGAGKSTTADTLFRDMLPEVAYVNADIIAQGLSANDPGSVAMEAGAIMLRRLHAMADARLNIGFESTGASRSFAPWLRGLKASGYRVCVYFYWLSSADMAVARVAERVKAGGHFVPDETVRRRYDLGLRNFFALYRPLAATWALIDNSQNYNPRMIAQGGEGSETVIQNVTIWEELLLRFGK